MIPHACLAEAPREFKTQTGRGVSARVGETTVFVGSELHLADSAPSAEALDVARQLGAEGKSVVFVSVDGRVAGLVAGIARASAEQASGIDQVNRALTEMDELTQQNSALVEQSAATAKSLAEQAVAMRERVAVFGINDAGHGAKAA